MAKSKKPATKAAGKGKAKTAPKRTKLISKSKSAKTKSIKLPNSKSLKSKILVTKHMNINEIISRYPNTLEVFFKHGFYCIGCQGAAFESLEDGAKVHGMDDKQIDQMVCELNEHARQENKFKPEEKEFD